MKEKEQLLEVAMSAAVKAGNFLLEHSEDFLKVSQKESLRDIVTEIEKCAEKEIIKILKDYSPCYPILTEESGIISGKKSKKKNYWIVDPLDGTVNYVNRIPFYAVSIAFVEKESPLVGVVYSPPLNSLYYGARGIGVYKNHTKIKVKDQKPPECLFAVTFSGKKYNSAARKEEFIMFEKVNDSTRGCLRTGSAAMNLSYLAEGKLGGCWGKMNKIWDIAAGLLLAELAGATIEYKVGNTEKNLVSYIATVPSAWNFIKKRVRL